MNLRALIRTGDIALMESMAAAGCLRIINGDCEFMNFLGKLIKNGQVEKLERLLQCGLDPNDHDYDNVPDEFSLLSFAKYHKQEEIVNLLFKYGASKTIRIEDYKKFGIYKPAADNEFLDFFYANVDLKRYCYPIMEESYSGYAALHLAVMDNNPKYVEMLLKRGAHVDTVDARNDYTSLCCALDLRSHENHQQFGNSKEKKDVIRKKLPNLEKIVEILLHHGASILVRGAEEKNLIQLVDDFVENVHWKFARIKNALVRYISMYCSECPPFFLCNHYRLNHHINSNRKLSAYSTRCYTELKNMESKMLEGVEISLKEILKQKSIGVSRYVNFYANSPDQMDVQEVVKKFLIYRRLLLNNFEEADDKIKLKIQATNGLSKLFKRTLTVGHLVTGYIFDYLKEDDLKALSSI